MRIENASRGTGFQPVQPARSHGLITRATVLLVLLGSGTAAFAQSRTPIPAIIEQVGIDQKLDAQLPLYLTFKDETGRDVTLAEYFDRGKPVVLSLVYYQCPMLCTMTLNGMTKSFKPLTFDVGKEFTVLTISFDAREKPELAAQKKSSYVDDYGRSDAADGWHFLTGEQPAIDRLTAAVGFRYLFDENSRQFAHSSAIIVLTPSGKISRYFYGLEYAPKDLRLGLIEASEEKIGTLADKVMLLCFKYDPTTGKYGFAIMTALRIGAVVTMLAIGGFMLFMFRRDRNVRATPVSPTSPGMQGS